METTKRLMTVREIELNYIPDHGILKRKKVTDSRSAYHQLLEGFNPNTIGIQEEFVVLFLNRANFPIGIQKLGKGGVSGVLVDLKLLFATALKCLASGIIISHNHPSGSLISSCQDKELTAKVKSACELLEIKLLDHIIISPFDSFYSFVDEGELS